MTENNIQQDLCWFSWGIIDTDNQARRALLSSRRLCCKTRKTSFGISLWRFITQMLCNRKKNSNGLNSRRAHRQKENYKPSNIFPILRISSRAVYLVKCGVANFFLCSDLPGSKIAKNKSNHKQIKKQQKTIRDILSFCTPPSAYNDTWYSSFIDFILLSNLYGLGIT